MSQLNTGHIGLPVIAKTTPVGGRCGTTCYTDYRMEWGGILASVGVLAPVRREKSKKAI